jgi:hypothetical protein
MARHSSGGNQHCIETNVANTIVRILRKPSLGCRNDAGALSLGHRPGGIVLLLASLDLDEDQQASASGDDVDFSDRASPAARKNAKSLGDEKGRRSALG